MGTMNVADGLTKAGNILEVRTVNLFLIVHIGLSVHEVKQLMKRMLYTHICIKDMNCA